MTTKKQLTPAQVIRRHDRIYTVWQRTPSANTAERCRLRLAALGRQAREEFDAYRVAQIAKSTP